MRTMWIVAAVMAAACTVGLGTGCKGDKSSETSSGAEPAHGADCGSAARFTAAAHGGAGSADQVAGGAAAADQAAGGAGSADQVAGGAASADQAAGGAAAGGAEPTEPASAPPAAARTAAADIDDATVGTSPPADFPVPLPHGVTGGFTSRVLGSGARAMSGTVAWKGTIDEATAYFERVLRDRGLEPIVKKVASRRGETVSLKARAQDGAEARVLIMASGGEVAVTISWRGAASR